MLTWSSIDVEGQRPAATEPTLSHLVVAATFGVFAELGAGGFTRLLETIAEGEPPREKQQEEGPDKGQCRVAR
jgi:hypothetical protein